MERYINIDYMLTFVKNLFFVLIIWWIVSFLVLASVVFGETEQVSTHQYIKENEVKQYMVTEWVSSESATKSLIYKEIGNLNGYVFDKGSALYVAFGRLASAFVLPGNEMQGISEVLTLSWREVTLKHSWPMIISLYDPFSLYKIHSASGEYSIDQVTNGSFYVWREENNTISVYSIDTVVKLNFLFSWEHMADIVLFPGMYVRFNPVFNRIFKWVTDPFRVAQVVESDEDQNTAGTTGIEFVNPRMENSENTDTFFMYRLPPNTRILFRMLHTMFHDKVAQVEDMKSYASQVDFSSDAGDNSWLLNPSKMNHFLLLQLKWALSQGLQFQTTFESFTKRVAEIRNKAEGLAIGNSVNQTFEEFLTDGRFALFSTTVSPKYEKIYQEVASIVGIAPSTGKAKLFQKLSDIYSHNLVTQKKDLTFSKIDTYSPTATELQATLGSSDISHKDFFDIALYAFSILEKAKDRQFFESQAMSAHATYQLLSTLFVATSKYASSVEDTDQRAKTYRSIALHFYDPMLRVFTRSLYYYYTYVDGRHIFLNEKALNAEGKIKLSKDLVRDMKNLDSTVRGIYAEIQWVYANETDISTLMSIKRSMLRIKAFASIIQDSSYSTYVLSPYLAINDNDVDLPQMSDDENSVITDVPVILDN